MAEELGKIEKPAAEQFKTGRKLFFIPLLAGGESLPDDYKQKLEKYWKQVADQIADLSNKLGKVARVYHELIGDTGEEAAATIKEMNSYGYAVIETYQKSGAVLEAAEDADILTEFMDWSRCLYVGLQNPRVLEQVYKSYTEASNKRTEAIEKRLDESLGTDEIGIIIMSENHHVQFPKDIQVFYVAPPALDEIKRWLRDQESAAARQSEKKDD